MDGDLWREWQVDLVLRLWAMEEEITEELCRRWCNVTKKNRRFSKKFRTRVEDWVFGRATPILCWNRCQCRCWNQLLNWQGFEGEMYLLIFKVKSSLANRQISLGWKCVRFSPYWCHKLTAQFLMSKSTVRIFWCQNWLVGFRYDELLVDVRIDLLVFN